MSPSTLQCARVLLVEDHDASAEDYVRWLRAASFIVERASAASEALIRAADFHPDVILLDLQIPSGPGEVDEDVEHGFRTLDKLLERTPDRPIIVFSAIGETSAIARRIMQHSGKVQFISKGAEDLKHTVLMAVERALVTGSSSAG